MRAVGFFKLRLGSEDLKRTDKDASRGTVSLLRLSRQIRNYIWSVIKKLFLFLNQWIFLLRQIKDDLVCGSFPDVFVLESRLYSCCSFSASLNFAFCVSAIAAVCVCVCVISRHTDLETSSRTRGRTGAECDPLRWKPLRTGWVEACRRRTVTEQLNVCFSMVIKKNKCDHKRRITTHLIVSSKICASRSCSMFAWRKTRFSRSSSFFKTTSLFLSSLVVLFRTLDSQWAAISSNGAFWNFSITWRLFSLSCSSRPVVSEPRGQSGLHYVTLNLFYDETNTELTFSSQRDFQLMSDLSFSLTSRTVRIYLEMSNRSDPGATGELDFSCNGF